MKVVSVVGARPQFIKAAAVSRTLRQKHREVLVHTGQHYDENMSSVFFEELNIPTPEVHLGVGSGLHGAQTGAMLAEIEQVLLKEEPDWVLVYGDTNSTIAGALAAAKLHIPVAHVEAGLRSYNRRMPEEVNRVLTDHVSDLLLCPSEVARDNLRAEGITRGVHVVGDVMADALQYAVEQAGGRSTIISRLGLQPKGYLLATVHRAENTDDTARLENILAAFLESGEKIIFPLHPRTRKALEVIRFDFSRSGTLCFIEPVGYLDMVMLESHARLILTDSGGIQKEAYWLGVPCITLRDETEWVETVEAGWNVLTGAKPYIILEKIHNFAIPDRHPMLYGDGCAAERCVALLESRQNTHHNEQRQSYSMG